MPKRFQRTKSEYGQQFEEKQGLKAIYGLRERQFRSYFGHGKGPDLIIQGLERRLDSTVYRCGFASTRKFARQLVSHGHIQVNGRNVNSPSFGVKVSDTISIHPLSIGIVPFKELTVTLAKYEVPSWINLDKKNLTAVISAEPTVEDPMIMASVKPIIEFYSR
jgi:small subunit ribosomal protein S4